MTNLKKYTNADFYKNGVFQQEIAIEAHPFFGHNFCD